MSCNYYVHNDSAGGTKYISGTTCHGTVGYYYLTIGQAACMDESKPLINLNGLVISGTCLPVTPTPSTTPYSYCYYSADTVYFGTFQCPNNGVLYQDVYGKMTLYATIDGVIVSSHPDLVFVVSNGTEYETITIPDGQEFTEFVFPKVNFYYTETGCELEYLPDWEVYTPPTTRCLLFTPTPTATPTVTPTMTQTPTQTETPTQTPTNTATQTPTPTTTTTLTSTPTQTPTQTETSTPTPTNTSTMTQTPTRTSTQTPTPTNTSTKTPTPTQTATKTQTPTQTQTSTPTPTVTPGLPPTIPDIFQWFDASILSGMELRTSGSNTYVKVWNPRIGNTVSQYTDSQQPLLVENQKGFPYSGVTFVGTENNMSGLISPTVPTPSGNTTFIVSYLENGINQLMWSIDTDVAGEAVSSYYINENALPETGNTVEMRSINKLISNRKTTSIPNFPKVLGIVSGNTTSTLGRFNDIQTTTSRTYSAGPNMNRIRMGNPDSSLALMILYEVIVYNRVLTSTEIGQVENYLKQKWNYANWAPTPTPTASNTPTPSITASVTPTKTGTPTPTPTACDPTPYTIRITTGSSPVLNLQVTNTGSTQTLWTDYNGADNTQIAPGQTVNRPDTVGQIVGVSINSSFRCRRCYSTTPPFNIVTCP